MNSDKLSVYCKTTCTPNGLYYDKPEVDALLAEKDEEIYNQKWRGDEWAKACNQKDKEIESLKASHYAESVDAGMRERRLRRALWLARADRAMMTLDYFTLKCRWFKDYMKVEPPGCDVKMVHKWANVERKCRAKAEEYK